MNTKIVRGQVRIMTEKVDLTRVITTGLFMLREMVNLTLAAAVDHSKATTALLELHLAGRLVQLVELATRIGASNELSR